MIWEDLGAVSAYAIVKEKGYTGTEEKFARMLINAEKIPELMEDVDYLKRNLLVQAVVLELAVMEKMGLAS